MSKPPETEPPPLSFVFSTPVWGSNHISVFLSIGLPSLLAAGNLPDLATAIACRYRIYTRPQDRAQLQAAPAFCRLTELLPVEIKEITEAIEVPHRTMSDCHIDTMTLADEERAAAVFIPPDCVWSSGSMMNLLSIAQSGKSVVHMSGIRLDRDAVVPELARCSSDDGQVLAIGARQLTEIGLKHLHPIAYSHFWNEHDGGLMPANLMWTVSGEGLLLRCFHLHPLMVRSQVPFAKFSSTIDDDLLLYACPDESRDHIVSDSDEILAFELSGLDRIVGVVCPKGSVEGAAGWAELGTNLRHRALIRQPIRVHSTPTTETLWARRIADSDRVVGRLLNLVGCSTLGLLARGETRVLSDRMVAASFGHGATGIARPLWSSIVYAIRAALQALNSRLYGWLFLSGDRPRMAHPSWLVWQSSVAATLQCLGAGDRTLAVIGADPAVIREIEARRPDLKVVAIDGKTSLRTAASELQKDFAVVIAMGLDDDGEVMPALTKLSAVGLKSYLLRLSRSAAAEDSQFNVRGIGGIGTRLSAYLSKLMGSFRARVRALHGATRLLVRAVGLLSAPVVYMGVAMVGLVSNSIGVLLDRLTPSVRSAEPAGPQAFTTQKVGKEQR